MRTLAILSLVTALLPIRDSRGCATDLTRVHAPASGPWAAYQAARLQTKRGAKKTALQQKNRRKISSSSDTLPSAQGPMPWGGADPTKWKAEAILANAVSEALNDGWQQSSVHDVLVSVPVKMQYGNDRPYVDGQSNASPEFSDPGSIDPVTKLAPPPWTQHQPPFTATWITFDGGRPPQLKLRFSQFLPGLSAKGTATISYSTGGVKQPNHLITSFSPTPAGDIEATWIPSNDGSSLAWGDAFHGNVAFVQAPGRTDWFPLDFRDVVFHGADLLSKLPAAKRSFTPGATELDPANLATQSGNSQSGIAMTPYQKLLALPPGTYGHGSTFYATITGIHNLFNNDVKAVGDGTTWLFLPPVAGQPPPSQTTAPFKMAYICFDPRGYDAEAQFGVPSGGGWHEIGDPAETVFNTLETAPVVFGYANSQAAPVPSGSYFNGLTDIAVIRKLKPGDALMTTAGPTTQTEGTWQNENWPLRAQNGAAGRNYHWFIFNQERDPLPGGGVNRLCAFEWVHPCVPSASDPAGVACQ